MHSNAGKIIKKIFKVLAWIIGSVIILLLAVALLIQIPALQLKLTQKAVNFLEEKIGTEVALEGIAIRFPKQIVLEGIYLEDQSGDTLLYAGKFAVDTDLWALMQNEIQLNNILLENVTAFVDRTEQDSAFNFSYILDAFAGDSTAVPDTLEQKEWGFSLERIELANIRLSFDDRLAGNHATVALGAFELDMEDFDLKNNRYGVEEIILSDTRAKFTQSKIPVATEVTEEKSDSAAALIFSLARLDVHNVNLQYEQTPLAQKMEVNLGSLEIEPERIDLERQAIELKSFSMANTLLSYHQSKPDTILTPPPSEAADTLKSNAGWQFALNRLDLENNTLKYTDEQQPRQQGSLDFNHLTVTELNVDARDLLYSPRSMKADLREFAFREQSGFGINTFTAKVDVSETEAQLSNFLLETDNSRMQMSAHAEYPSFERIGETWTSARITSDINESYLAVRDILYLQPAALDSMPLSLKPDTRLRIDASVDGAVSNLNIRHLAFSILSETTLRSSGTIAGLPDPGALRLDLAVDKFYTTRRDMEALLPDTLLPDSMQLPQWINLQAQYEGTLENADFNTALTSSAGGIDVKGRMNLDSASATRGINAGIDVRALDVGGLLGMPDSVMGSLAMRADIHANGLSPDEINGTVEASIDHFEFQGYRYRDIAVNALLRDQILTTQVSMDDNNLDFTLNAGYAFQSETPLYKILLDVRNADFQALNFSQSPIRGRGTLEVNMETADFKVLNGNVGVRKVAVFNGDDLYTIDSLLFASIDQKGRSEINIDSDVMTANFQGSINIFSLPAVLSQYFNTYYALHDSLDVEKKEAHQHFTFNVDLKNTDLLTGLLVPELTSFVPGKITGEFDSEARKLDLRMDIHELQYANIGIDSFVFSTNSNPKRLNYNVHVNKILIDSTKIDGLQFNGTVADNAIRTDLIILDSADRNKYVLAGTFLSKDDFFEFKFSPDDVILNYQPWNVPDDNLMRFGGEKFVARNVTLTNRREKIIIDSKPEPGTPIVIGFRELNLEYLTSMIAQERPLSGLLEGDINLYTDSSALSFTSDLAIQDFRIRDVPWGDISLQVDQLTKNRFDVDFALKGAGNVMTMRGHYQGGESAAMNLTADIQRFGLRSLQPVLAGQINDLNGELTGQITVRGTPERPDIDGGIVVKDTRFFSTYLNTPFSIDEESISFVEEGISFNAFEITDNQENKATLNGAILTSDYRDFRFNLDLNADQFRLFNTKKGDNELFYGRVDLEANVRIRGDMDTPVVTMDIGMADGSNLTYIVPQSESAVLESEGIVKFVDRTFEGDPFMKRTQPEAADTVKADFKGIDLTARIELTDQETFTIIIDPVTGDQLTIRGNTTLTLKIDPTGDINLVGRYEISEGTYNLSFYKFVKREFSIEQGSSIIWTGDPLNAEMDITAIYTLETAPIDLFSNQLSGADPAEANRYRQRLPFQVYLNISGQLLQPEIGFELEMPIDERDVFGGNVYARLQDINSRESDLNKQVFALLILKRFISDDPFESQAGGGFESTARRSVSKILSEQLNRLSENIKGVELSFDIKSYEDYSTGQAEGKTELQLGFSKSLLNDRLVVKLSGNIDLEGQDANRDATDYIGDLALEYKLTPDGRFRITGFRNSNYDMIDGELVETGAGLIYVKDYNALRELFKANAETRN